MAESVERTVRTEAAKNIDVKKLASIAKIWLSDEEADEMRKAMSPLLELAETIVDVDVANYTIDSERYDKTVMTVSDLRDDIPTRGDSGADASAEADAAFVPVERLIELSPTADDGGFTIPRLLEQ